MQFKQLRWEAWKSQDFNGVWTCDLAMPVRRSNQLNYEATDVGGWSLVIFNELVKNGCEVMYEMFHIYQTSYIWKHFNIIYMKQLGYFSRKNIVFVFATFIKFSCEKWIHEASF